MGMPSMISTTLPPFWTTRNPVSASAGATQSKLSVEATRLSGSLLFAESPGTQTQRGVSEVAITYDGLPTYSVSIMEFENEHVVHETQYFADPFTAAPGHAHLAERRVCCRFG